MVMTAEARGKMREATVLLLVASLGFALGFTYGRNASVVPIIIEKCGSMSSL